jgi:type VI secretion system protein VasD
MDIPRRSFAALALAGLLAACSSPPPPPPPPGIVELTISASADVNPDVEGRASPVIVRVYQLASAVKFENVDFFALFDKEQATLGADLLGREEVAVSPGEEKKLTINLKPDARSIGVAAAFRDIDQAQWRADAEVPPHGTTPAKAELSKLAVTLLVGS